MCFYEEASDSDDDDMAYMLSPICNAAVEEQPSRRHFLTRTLDITRSIPAEKTPDSILDRSSQTLSDRKKEEEEEEEDEDMGGSGLSDMSSGTGNTSFRYTEIKM